MFGILISNAQSLKLKIIPYDAVKCSWRRVQHKLVEAQVVVNAQSEDRTRARICPGDFLKRAGLFIHQMKTVKKGPNGHQRLPEPSCSVPRMHRTQGLRRTRIVGLERLDGVIWALKMACLTRKPRSGDPPTYRLS